ncbi:NAD(P)/FAD-dependent oxidoreductase [Scleromatobacter humisilvae]|uniref:FAD-binding oxidoreductase n=1 Tax=Scleromatobacter humisilvae TaxID=2897159 RepID=A0A9X1YGA1_9BURK|nr:FAD-binding oxidoreductase [Scleromatobacter humisilvae]MCK9685421.1 FAD-binding oxidoreductase [Scleromatobacter humisilvae]
MQGDPLTHGLWEMSAPPAPETPPLRGQIAVDVAVVGAGFTGLSAALHVAEAGRSVAVLEAADIGFGASGRNVGLVNAGLWVMPDQLSQRLGATHGARLLQALGEAPSVVFDLVARHRIACEAVRHGTLHCAVGARGLAGLRERAAQWHRLGAPVRLLDAAETAARTGTSAYAGALLDLRAGTIQPLAYVRGLAWAAARAGASLHGDSPVVGVEDLGSRWRLKVRGGGEVDAGWVIVATNACTSPDGPWPALATELVRMPYFNLATAPLPDRLAATILPHREGAWDTRAILSSFRRDEAGRLVFGSIGALRGPGHAIHRGWGRRALAKLFPQLRDVGFEHEWYGWIGTTPDALPRFHQLARNVVSFSGYNGRGIAPGTVFGRELARLVLGEGDVEGLSLPDAALVAFGLKPLREAFYEAGAQVAHAVGARW